LEQLPTLTTRQAIKLENIIVEEAVALKADSIAMLTYGYLGEKYTHISEFATALNSYLKELALAEKRNDYKTQVKATVNLSWIYKTTGETYNTPADIDKAGEYLQKALLICRSHNLIELEAHVLSNIAIGYDIKKMHNKAIETYKQIIPKLEQFNDVRFKTTVFMNMGISYKNDKQFNNALAAYQTAMKQVDSTHAKGPQKCYITDNMANLYFEMNQLPLSEKMALDALQLANTKDGSEAALVDMDGLLIKLYSKEGRYKDALDYSTKLSALKDSVFNKEKSLQLKDMQEKYDTDNKDKQITAQQAQITYNKKLNLILAGGGIAALLIAGFIYYNLRKTAKLNKIVSSQRDVLSKQSEKLSVMMKELHHRVKNNLQIVSSLLNLQSMRLVDEGAINAVQESKQRVQAMSLIHQRLYKTDDITRVNMKEYIKELADFLAVSYGYNENNFALELDAEEEWVDIDKALPMGLILNELLTNAFKYAFGGIEKPCLHITFKHEENNFVLNVKDNGKGISIGVWNDKRSKSFGRQLVKALCGQLRAKEKLEVVNGTSFTFTIPEAA